MLIQFLEGPPLNIPELQHFFRFNKALNKIHNNVYHQKSNNSNQQFDRKGKIIIGNQEEIELNYSEIYEADKDEIVEIDDNNDIVENFIENEYITVKYADFRINVLYKFVEAMKKKLGFHNESEWENLRKYPWELNYEPLDFINKKYNG